MEKIYIVLEYKSEDYHGTYKEIISTHRTEESARIKAAELNQESQSCDIEYDWDVYNIDD